MILLKNAADIEAMKPACQISAKALEIAGKFMQPGITTKEIDNEMHKFIVQSGAKPSFMGQPNMKGDKFPATACISINNQIIHGIPSHKVRLKEGDIVSVDVGAYYNGYHGDNAYTFAVGKISAEARQLLDVTEECLKLGIAQAKPGNRIGDISNAVQQHAESFGFGVVREFVGHGVGESLHEDPEVPNFGKPGRGPRIVPGMTIAIEPMINLKGAGVRVLPDGWTTVTESGSISAHFENTIVITESGPQILTIV